MKVGFAKNDITPRVGVELCGFGPFECRHSIGVRDNLWARAMAVQHEQTRAVLVSCDLIGTTFDITRRVREIVAQAAGIAEDAIMIACSHTHSGPNTGPYIGWGEADPVYRETLPSRIARACIEAVESMREAELAHTVVPCEGIGVNREYDEDAPPLEQVLKDDWRPKKPELTDTTCNVLTAMASGKLIGFVSYFGCHPVVCSEENRHIHGDYCGVATNMLERENPGSVGLFLQGGHADVNSCVVHKGEQESLLALDLIASRYANAVRDGIGKAKPISVDGITCHRRSVTFSRKDWGIEKLREMLAEYEARLHHPDARDHDTGDDYQVRMSMVYTVALRRLIALAEKNEPLNEPTEIHGMRIGPVAILGSGFETFQAIKNDVVGKASGPVTLVTSFANDSVGYAPDRTCAARGGYAADMVPLICGQLPYANIHDELVEVMLSVDEKLR